MLSISRACAGEWNCDLARQQNLLATTRATEHNKIDLFATLLSRDYLAAFPLERNLREMDRKSASIFILG